jgi:ribosome-binding protein aMBF1 (putative translation factor)
MDNMEAYMTPVQSRIARGSLGWSHKDLAAVSKVAAMTIYRFEAEKG